MKAVYVVKFRADEKTHHCVMSSTYPTKEDEENGKIDNSKVREQAGEIVRFYKELLGITEETEANSIDYAVWFKDESEIHKLHLRQL